jgi:hypothetical protein
LEAEMARIWKMVKTGSAVVLAAVVLAACTSDTTAVAPDGFADTLLSSSLRLSTGSVNMLGVVSGLKVDTEVILEGLVFGGYAFNCLKDEGNTAPPGQQLKLEPVGDSDYGTANRRGAVQFSTRNGNAPSIERPVRPTEANDADCPGPSNNFFAEWADEGVWRLSHVYARYADVTGDKDPVWFAVSWTCDPYDETLFVEDSKGKLMTAAESCIMDEVPAEGLLKILYEDWDDLV